MSEEPDLSLERIDRLRGAIEKATSVQEIKDYLNAAKTFLDHIKRARKTDKAAQQRIIGCIHRADHKLGEMLRSAKEAGQIARGNRTGANQYKSGNVDGDDNSTFTLEKAGISRDLSSRAQRIAAIPKAEFEKVLSDGEKAGTLTLNMFNQKGHRPPAAHPARPEIVELSDAGLSQSEIAATTGVSKHTLRREIEREAIKRQAKAEGKAEIDISREMLSLSAQQKFDRAIAQEKQRLGNQYRADVYAAAQELLADTIGPRLEHEQKVARGIMKHRRGVMTRKEFNQIRACLHTDKNASAQEKHDAFVLFTSFEKYLLKEAESPTEFTHIPSTRAEWEALKKQAAERRKRKHKGANSVTK